MPRQHSKLDIPVRAWCGAHRSANDTFAQDRIRECDEQPAAGNAHLFGREHWADCGKNKTSTMLLEQLSFFGFAFTRPENALQKKKMAISGKSSGGKDDLCMALLIGLFFVVEDRFILRGHLPREERTG